MLKLKLVRDRALPRTLVDQVVDEIASIILQRLLGEGTRLPSVRELAKENGLSAFTVAEAYLRLVSMGLISSKPGSGYRVSARSSTSAVTAPPAPPPSLNAAWLLSDVFADKSVPIKAGCGWIPESWINETGLQHALRVLSRIPGTRLGGYGHPYGLITLRELIGANLKRCGLNVDASNVLLTEGATQAIDLVVRTLLRPGDVVIVEDPCYCNLLQILKLAGLTVIGVTRTLDGVDIEALETVCTRHRPKAIFINTTLQNPTGASFSMASAFRVLQIAERFDLWLIEDDICRELAEPIAPSLAAMDGLRRVVYVSGFSKTISPKLRAGYIVAAARLLADLARTKMAVGLTSSEVNERLVANMLIEGHYERHIDLIKAKLKDSHTKVVERFRELRIEAFATPNAGLFIWAKLPIDPVYSDEFTTLALKQGSG